MGLALFCALLFWPVMAAEPESPAMETPAPAQACSDDLPLAQTAAKLGQQWQQLEAQTLKAADNWLLLMLDRALTAWQQPWEKDPLRNEEQLKTAIAYFATPVRLLHPQLEIPLTLDKVPRTRAYAWHEDMAAGTGVHSHRYGPETPNITGKGISLADLLFYFDVNSLDTSKPNDRYIIDFCISLIINDTEVEKAYDRFVDLASQVSHQEPEDSMSAMIRLVGKYSTDVKIRLLAEYDPPFRFFRRSLLNPAIRDRHRLSQRDISAWIVSARNLSAAAAQLQNPDYPKRETDMAATKLADYNRNAGPFLQSLFDAIDVAGINTDSPTATAVAAIFLSRGMTVDFTRCPVQSDFTGWNFLLPHPATSFATNHGCGITYRLPITRVSETGKKQTLELIIALAPNNCGMSLYLQQVGN